MALVRVFGSEGEYCAGILLIVRDVEEKHEITEGKREM
jgi:hypothetical protein